MRYIPLTCDPDRRLKRVPLADLVRFQGDFKTLHADHYAKLKRSIEINGFFAPVFVWAGKNYILDGHQRFNVLEREGWDIEGGVPVVELQVRDEQHAAEITLTLSSTYGKVDSQGLYEFTAEKGVDLREFDVVDLPDLDVAEYLDEYYKDETPEGDPDAVPEPPVDPVSKTGDLWLLGDHRVLCGDSTSAEDVGRVLAGNAPGIMVTDPPYGVEYDANWRNEAAEKGLIAHADRRVGVVTNDEKVDWSEAWALFPGDVVYCWHADRHASAVQDSLIGFEVRAQIIWGKGRFAISRGHYHWQHEPCWYAIRQGATARWGGDRSQTTLWNIALDANIEGGHSTQKPLECMARPLRNHDIPEVYDPFLGSGTTLIAAEETGRVCYGLEIAPQYVDVIVNRWQNHTGQAATLDGDGRTFAEIAEAREVTPKPNKSE